MCIFYKCHVLNTFILSKSGLAIFIPFFVCYRKLIFSNLLLRYIFISSNIIEKNLINVTLAKLVGNIYIYI